MALTLTDGSASIGASEFWLASNSTSKSDQTTDVVLQCWIDFGAMQAGDVYEWRVVEKINGGTQLTMGPGRVVGVQAAPVILTGLVLGDGWEIGVKKISGTDRTIAWSLREIT